ncbi:MAG: Maf family protein [Planctomycetota bacterium]|nr:Maf family protein [Planctomycetota bacterium]
MPDLILASTSPYRRRLLERLGAPFRCVAPECDEAAVKAEGLPPRMLAEKLARLKAASIAAREPHAVVLGGDQIAVGPLGILDKPGAPEAAAAQLRQLSGRTHELITAVAVQRGDVVRDHTDVARLTMRELDATRIEAYLDADQPWDCAGSYKLESRGIGLFERIECADFTAIEGLPLMALAGILRELGVGLKW